MRANWFALTLHLALLSVFRVLHEEMKVAARVNKNNPNRCRIGSGLPAGDGAGCG